MIFCDNHILIVDKPPGLSTQSHGKESLEEWAKEYLKKRFNKPGRVFLEPIHRLDTPVGGLVLFARTSKALSRLQQQQRERNITKIYRALIKGSLLPEGKLIHNLVHGDRKAIVSEEGKRCELSYKTLKTDQHHSLVEITLTTGRYHQIRAQFSAIGHPILGDRKYGSKETFPTGIALSHVSLSFIHPVTQEPVQFRSKNFTIDILR